MSGVKEKIKQLEYKAIEEIRKYIDTGAGYPRIRHAKPLWSERRTVAAASTVIVEMTLTKDEYVSDIIVWGTTDDYKVLFRGSEEVWSGAHDGYGAMPHSFKVPIKFYKGDVLRVYSDVDSGTQGCSIYVLVTKEEDEYSAD